MLTFVVSGAFLQDETLDSISHDTLKESWVDWELDLGSFGKETNLVLPTWFTGLYPYPFTFLLFVSLHLPFLSPYIISKIFPQEPTGNIYIFIQMYVKWLKNESNLTANIQNWHTPGT